MNVIESTNVWHKGVSLFKSQCSDQYVQSCVLDFHCVYVL